MRRVFFGGAAGHDVVMRTGLILFLLVLGGTASRADTTPLHRLSRTDQEQRVTGDLKAVLVYRQGLHTVTPFVQQQTNLFPPVRLAEPGLPRRGEKEVLWSAWKSALDYLLALDALDHYHRDFYRLSGERRARSFVAGHTAFLAKYRFNLEFIEAAEKNPFLDTILNESVPELGLPAGTYAKLKFRYLNVAIASEFAARLALYPTMQEATTPALREAIEQDTAAILRMGCGPGELLTARNALRILQRTGDKAWFPVQAGVAEWMGDVKVHRAGRSLISPEQIRQLLAKLQPGDVLLTRREWYLSNIGLPGFWPHAALYIGTAEERRRFFAGPDLEVRLQARNPAAYARSLLPQEHGHVVRALEAMSEGVSFTTLEHCADADSLVALRPLLPKPEKAVALLRAFHYAGRPYDFNFDFATDAELVCTELVFKAYEPADGMRGLCLPLVDMLGRKVLPANEIVRQFDEELARGEPQFEFIAFLDGHDRRGRAVEAGLAEFRQSWRRPKWHVLTQPAAK